MDLPPELIAAIVSDVGSTADLRACTLAARRFRFPCQQRLLGTLWLGDKGGGRKGYLEAAARFERWPHLAPLVRTLDLAVGRVPYRWAGVDGAEEAIAGLFARLACVTALTVFGDNDDWRNVTPILADALARWLAGRPPGAFRHVSFVFLWDIPRAVVHAVFRALAPHAQVNFEMATLDGAPSRELAPYMHTMPPFGLHVQAGPRVERTLAEPEFRPYVQGLRTLLVPVKHGPAVLDSMRLCEAAAGNLEHLQLLREAGGLDPDYADLVLPPCLPALTHLTLDVASLAAELRTGTRLAALLTGVVLPLLRPAVTPRLAAVTLRSPLASDRARELSLLVDSPGFLVHVLREEAAQACLRLIDDALASPGRRTARLALVFTMHPAGQSLARAAAHRQLILPELARSLQGVAREGRLDVVVDV
ncbi:hypothetical protein MIND_01428800 [Mycena indigotica]|uniref:F-box domain-containing protein n=1 Tax=Mycena indigotica TaxID=2126181 RepID=A0A8H6RXA0_9AGAR|nr:uncharacterized protein MIND_01428800 [Mycena indigotica]KAF7288621.1 hypothetical protein MIND_01428800 [Mycena indigotica]